MSNTRCPARAAPSRPTARRARLRSSGSNETARTSGSDAEDVSVRELERTREPSWGWGWHGGFRHGSLIAGWATTAIVVAILVSRLTGTHTEGHVADVYLAVICAGLMLALIRAMRRRRR